MPPAMEVVEYSPDLLNGIVAAIDGKPQKSATRQIVRRFAEAGLPIKVKRYFLRHLEDAFRVLCFIKKSGEAVIINTDGMGGNGMTIQLRILNGESFARLDELTESVRNQILHANDCRYCSPKCGKKRYVFAHRGAEHVKCQFLCSNFRLMVENKNDIASVMALVERELDLAVRRKK